MVFIVIRAAVVTERVSRVFVTRARDKVVSSNNNTMMVIIIFI